MSLIYHAAKDENKRYHGGKAGDQTKEEVYARTWYSRPWTQVYRHPSLGTQIAKVAKAIVENDMIGYNQYDRNSLVTQAKKVSWDIRKIKVSCNTDCSAMASVCCMAVGLPENLFFKGNCCTSSTIGDALKKAGFVEHIETKYLNSPDYLLPGDILVCKGHHVAINGASGKYALHKDEPKNDGCPYKEPVKTLRKGDRGEGVRWVQWHLNQFQKKENRNQNMMVMVDGIWGTQTEQSFQIFQSLFKETGGINGPDGICGKKSVMILKRYN